jgi:hypothetical protein
MLDLLKIENWCTKKKIKVVYKTGVISNYDDFKRTITINKTCTLANKFYTLLHECGHALIMDNSIKSKVKRKNHPGRFTARDWYSDIKKIRKHHVNEMVVDVIDEETEAWRRGEQLAKRLKIKYDQNEFNKAKFDALMSYVKWGVQQ